MRTKHQYYWILLTIGLLASTTALAQDPLGTAITYQGELKFNDTPVNDNGDLHCTLYDDPYAGVAMAETWAFGVDFVDGLFSTQLDFGAGVFDGTAYWMEIEVSVPKGSPLVTLSGRQPITAAPYALYALDSAGGGECLWSQNGSDIYYNTGEVGAGTSTPSYRMHAVSSGGNTAIGGENPGESTSGYLGHEIAGVYGEGYYAVWGETSSENGYGVYGTAPGNGKGVAGYSGAGYGYLGWNGGGAYGYSADGYGVRGYSVNDWGVFGSVPYGSTQAGVIGAITLSGGQIQWVPESGVCGSSEDGYGVSGRVDGGIAVYGVHDDTGNFGHLATSGEGVYGETDNTYSSGVRGKADINSGYSYGVFGETTGSTFGYGVYGYADNSSGAGVYGYNASGGKGVIGRAEGMTGNTCGVAGYTWSPQGNAVYGEGSNGGTGGEFYSGGGTAGEFRNLNGDCVTIDHDAGIWSTAALKIDTSGTEEPVAIDVDVDATYGRLADFELNNATAYIGTSFKVRSDCGGDVAEFINTNTTTSDSSDYAVYAEHQGAGSGVYGKGAARGMSAICYPTGSSTYYGLYSYVNGGSGTNRAIYARAINGATNYAGYFSGDVTITGMCSKGGGTFQIDHPLDPENKYLYHSFVESPDMMNIYNGNVVLDASGEATVTMPEWFEALNMEFRYQLTCIGGFAQVYVAEEIADNQFKIAGGSSGLKVSWQVTGVRQDPFANANRVQVEVNKPEKEIGTYLHPEAWGKSPELQVDYVREAAEEAAHAEGLSAN
ncbi:MAG: hypothetical protein KAY37_05205 [Phycisphaerae bacterium]|nr:hypothetical protein [Phycisphaerae bacterium]